MTQMMPQGRGDARGAEGGRRLIGQAIRAVGECGGAAAQTPCVGARGLARAEGANMGAAWGRLSLGCWVEVRAIRDEGSAE